MSLNFYIRHHLECQGLRAHNLPTNFSRHTASDCGIVFQGRGPLREQNRRHLRAIIIPTESSHNSQAIKGCRIHTTRTRRHLRVISLGESSHNSHAIKCCRMHTTRTRTVSGRRHDSLSFSEIDNDSPVLPVGLNRPTRRACSACIEWQCWDRMAIFLILLSTVQLRWIVVTVFDVSACRLRDTQIHIVDTIGKVQLQSFPFCWS